MTAWETRDDETHVLTAGERRYLLDVTTGCFFALSPEAEKLVGGSVTSRDGKAGREFERLKSLGLIGSPARTDELPPLRPLTAICLFLTYDCNLRCRYCYEMTDEAKCWPSGRLSLDTARAAVDFLIQSSADEEQLKITFFGGEPLLNVRLFEFVLDYSRKRAGQTGKNMSYSITTNGTIFSEHIVSLVKEYNVAMVVSFDGPPDIQDRMRPFARGKGSYQIVAGNIRKYQQAGVPIQIRATITETMSNVERVFDFFRNEGLGEFILSPASGHLCPDLDEVESSVVSLLRKCGTGEVPAEVLGRYVNLKRMALRIRVGKRRNFACGAAVGQVAVSPDGRLYPCHRFVGMEEFELGSLASGLDEEKRQDFVRQSFLPARPACSGCWARYFCGGGCAYTNHFENGRIDKPSRSRCNVFRSTLQLLLPLVEDQKI